MKETLEYYYGLAIESIEELDCSFNSIGSLNNLPCGLKILFCESNNKLKSNVSRKAKALGLKTNSSREFSDNSKLVVSENTKKWIK